MYRFLLSSAFSWLTLVLFVTSAAAQSGTRAVPPRQFSVPQQGSTLRGAPMWQRGVPLQPGSTTRSSTAVQQGSTTRPGALLEQQRAGKAKQPPTFEQKLWGYLLRAKYRNWAPVPGESDGMYEGQSPHGAFLKMYLNRKAAGNVAELPSGSIVVKENYTPEKTLAAVTVMYRNKGYNPAAGDWYWVKYNPNGSVAVKPTPSGDVRLGGKVTGCIDCHSDAGGGDFAFFND